MSKELEAHMKKETTAYPSFNLAVRALAIASGRYNSDCNKMNKTDKINQVQLYQL